MHRKYKNDLKDSALAFHDLVWPIIKVPCCGGGDLVHIENEEKNMFDLYAGIDAWHLLDNSGIRGIASRVQWGQAYNSFTIRKTRHTGVKTEYEKRLDAIEGEGGWLFPHMTVQSYVSSPYEGRVLSIGVVKTKDLLLYVKYGEKNKDYIERTNGDDKNTFLVVFWLKLIAKSIKMYIYEDGLGRWHNGGNKEFPLVDNQKMINYKKEITGLKSEIHLLRQKAGLYIQGDFWE